MTRKSLWTAVFDVRLTERAEAFEGENTYGAFVNVYAYANSETAFLEIAPCSLESDGYDVLEITGCCETSLRDIPEHLHDLISDDLSNHSLAYGYFHMYPKDGLDA